MADYSRPRQTMADQSILIFAVLPASPMTFYDDEDQDDHVDATLTSQAGAHGIIWRAPLKREQSAAPLDVKTD